MTWTVTPDDAERWERAERRAAAVTVPDEVPVLRRFLLMELPVVLGVCLAVAVVSTTIWGSWRSWIGPALTLAALFCIVRGLVRTVKQMPEPRVSMVTVLTPEDRKRNSRQVLGREPVDRGQLNVLRLAARHMHGQAMRSVYSFAGLELLAMGNLVSSVGRSWFSVVFVAFTLLGVVLLVVTLRQIRLTTAFLCRYAEPTPVSAPSRCVSSHDAPLTRPDEAG